MANTQRETGYGAVAAQADDARPGLWPTAASVVLAGLACWFWILPQIAAGDRVPTDATVSTLAEIDPAEKLAALATLEPNSTVTAEIRRGARTCANRLAWVTIVRAPGEAAGTVRLISGSYVSPLFPLPYTPARVAIPFPGPYEAGQGTLRVLDAGGASIVALTPTVRSSAQAGGVVRHVVWRPSDRCPRGGA